MKILMVCLGNICRSPLAEGILKRKVREKRMDWEVGSAGTGAWHIGEPPDARSIRVARKHAIDISDQRARQIQAVDLEQYDLILAMDQNNFRDVLQLAKTEDQRDKVELILNLIHPGQNRSVPDPYWNDDGFQQVYEMLDMATDCLLDRQENSHSFGK